jgi:hypothetical protein
MMNFAQMTNALCVQIIAPFQMMRVYAYMKNAYPNKEKEVGRSEHVM